MRTTKLRLIVGGGRDFSDYELFCRELDDFTAKIDRSRLVIVHGACPTGADKFADDWMFRHGNVGVTVERHSADWSLGKKAGPMRNAAMVALGANRGICFWDGRSRGTKNLIELLQKAGIKTKIVRY